MPTNPPGADLDARSAGRSPNHRDVVSQSSVHGWQAIINPLILIKHICHLIVTVHGLDTGIHAGMTAFLARQDLCITARAGAWERAQTPARQAPACPAAGSRSFYSRIPKLEISPLYTNPAEPEMPSYRQGCRTNRQDSRFAQLRCPKGEIQGCIECIQRPRMASFGLLRHINQALASATSYRPLRLRSGQAWSGCIRNILVPNPSGNKAVQIGYPADLSGIHAKMTVL